jgi:hypothetical protein
MRGGAKEHIMADDLDHTERFSDEEAAFLRHVRFGELPPRVRPDERVELIETESRRDLPDGLNPRATDVNG